MKHIKKSILTLLLILMFIFPNSNYLFYPKIGLLLICLVLFVIVKDFTSYIYFCAVWLILFDLIQSEIYNHGYFTQSLSLWGSSIFGYSLILLIALICSVMLFYSWIKLIKEMKNFRWIQIGIVVALFLPNLYSLLRYHTPYYTNLFYVFIIGFALFVSSRKFEGSISSALEFLVCPFLILILTLTDIKYYKISTSWGVILSTLIVVFFIAYPLIKHNPFIKKHPQIISLFEFFSSLALLCTIILEDSRHEASMDLIITFAQFYFIQILIIIYFQKFIKIHTNIGIQNKLSS